MLDAVAGVFCGVFTGLVPGLHLNTFIPFLQGNGLLGFVVGVVIAHSFFDFLPSIFLGVPDESTALAVLPAHRMVLRGHALKAFQLSVFGGLFSSLLALLFLPFLFFLDSSLTAFLLLLVLFFMILTTEKKLLTLFVLVLSGVLGFNCLSEPNSLFALFSGFFGASTIVFSLLSVPRVPRQENTGAFLPGFREVFFGSLGGLFSGVMPGVSSSISGLAAKKLGGIGDEGFLVVLGGVNTVYAFTAIFAVHLIGKSRSGAGLFLGEPEPVALVSVVLFCLGLSAFLAFFVGSKLVSFFDRIPFRLLNFFSLFLLLGLTLFLGVFSLFLVSTCIGLVCVISGVRRSACMGSLLLPALSYYLL